ncbi:MAG: DUF975 family protein [Lachnospiraceae bacterium]|nr:DUF975 family protein [Lachnospiraceae bacterium]
MEVGGYEVMWAISKVKEIGKAAFRRNYWKAVLIAAIVSIVVSGASSSSGTSITKSITNSMDSSNTSVDGYLYDDSDSLFDEFEDDFENDLDFDDNGLYYYNDYNNDYDFENDPSAAAGLMAFIGAFLVVFMIILVVVLVIAIAIDVLIYNPLEVGGCRFFLENLKNPSAVREMAWAFDTNYKNVIKVMFFRDLYTVLWTLLLIVPGIIKAYEYRMIPYLMAENPNMSKEEAFARSRFLMDGNKWNAFVFDLSFIGWYILATIPFVGLLWVRPYKQSANAALYDAIRITKQQNMYGQNMNSNGFQQNMNPNGFQQNMNPNGFEQNVTPEQPVQTDVQPEENSTETEQTEHASDAENQIFVDET